MQVERGVAAPAPVAPAFSQAAAVADAQSPEGCMIRIGTQHARMFVQHAS